ncbi:MAG: SMC-Scp complex subunit ScpB [Thiotrichales bacterium]
MNEAELKQLIEAAIFAADAPLSLERLLKLFATDEQAVTRRDINEALNTIEQDCETRGIELKQVASGYRFQVKPAVAPKVSQLWEEKPQRYSRALLETLALIAYRQPVTRGEIEDVRGVAVSSHIIKTLIEREWVQVVGHREVPGRPALYATTREFLDYFNLSSLDQLPSLKELQDLDAIHPSLDLDGNKQPANEEAVEPQTQTSENEDTETGEQKASSSQ